MLAGSPWSSAGAVEPGDAGAATCDPGGVCSLDHFDAGPLLVEPSLPTEVTLFWAVGCSHCEHARQFLESLKRERPQLDLAFVEVRQDPAGRQRFVGTLRRLGATATGVPTIVAGSRYVVGFTRGVSEAQLIELVDAAGQSSSVSARGSAASKNPQLVSARADSRVCCQAACRAADLTLSAVWTLAYTERSH